MLEAEARANRRAGIGYSDVTPIIDDLDLEHEGND
jgi:hypothetical protein